MLGDPSPNKLIWPSFKIIFVLNCDLDLYFGSSLSEGFVGRSDAKIGCGTLKQRDQEEVRECHVGRDSRWRYGTLLTCISERKLERQSAIMVHCINKQEK
jgi:hypothetical protein